MQQSQGTEGGDSTRNGGILRPAIIVDFVLALEKRNATINGLVRLFCRDLGGRCGRADQCLLNNTEEQLADFGERVLSKIADI